MNTASGSQALVEAQGLTVRRGGRTVLNDVALSLESGRILTLVGPNGSGKTSLLRTLIGLEPYEGRLTRRRGLRVGYVPQHFAVDRNLPLPVGRFLRLSGDWRGREWLRAAREAGVEHLLRKPVQTLSGGELRRVLLARALARRPQLLALDEPAAGLDHVSQTELYKLIQDLRERYGFGILIISHDLHLVMAASDHVLCLGHGRICCHGTPHSVQEHPEYLALFGSELGPATAVFPHTHHDPATEQSQDGEARIARG